MQQRVLVCSASKELFTSIRKLVPHGLAEVVHHFDTDAPIPEHTVLAFVDGVNDAGVPHGVLEKLSAAAVYTVYVADEKHVGDDAIPDLVAAGAVDDILLVPLRRFELLSKIQHALRLARVGELLVANNDLKLLIEKFEEDLRIARSIQRTLIPEKFPQVHGMRVIHKYLSGLKSGGDYLDFFEFEDKTHVGILMSDSTGYGLSSAFMSVILRLAVKLSKDEARSPAATVARIFDELQLTMKPTEDLSMFYAVLNRKTFEFVYTSSGSVRFLHQGKEGELNDRSAPEVPSLRKGSKLALQDQRMTLNPGDRLVLFTDGFGETLKGSDDVQAVFKKTRGEDPIELINDFTFRVKSGLETEDDMPAQDCSVMVVDVEKRAMRLAK